MKVTVCKIVLSLLTSASAIALEVDKNEVKQFLGNKYISFTIVTAKRTMRNVYIDGIKSDEFIVKRVYGTVPIHPVYVKKLEMTLMKKDTVLLQNGDMVEGKVIRKNKAFTTIRLKASAREITLESSKVVMEGVDAPPPCSTSRLNGGREIDKIGNIGSRHHISVLGISDQELVHLLDLSMVSFIDIASSNLTSLEPLGELKHLRRIKLDKVQLRDWESLAHLSKLVGLSVENESVGDLGGLAKLKDLKRLTLSKAGTFDCDRLIALQKKGPLPFTELILNHQKVTHLESLWSITTFEEVTLNDCGLTSLKGIGGFGAVKRLYLTNNPGLEDPSPLVGLKSLGRLDLSGTKISDLTFVKSLPNISALILDGTKVTDLTPLRGLNSLKVLGLSRTEAPDLTPLGESKNLSQLYLNHSKVTDLAPLAGAEALNYLDVSYGKVTDLAQLSALKNLRSVNISGTKPTNVESLITHPTLQTVYLDRKMAKRPEFIQAIKRRKRFIRFVTPWR